MNHEGVIGAGNALPWRLKTDLSFFRKTTSNAVVIMGRRTFDSLGRKPLPNRFNVVLSHTAQFAFDSADKQTAYTVAEGLYLAEKAMTKYPDCYVIGGATMYEQFSSFVDRYIITLVDKPLPFGDTRVFLDMFGSVDDWKIVARSHHLANPPDDDANFSIIELIHNHPRKIHQLRKDAIEAYKGEARRNGLSSRWRLRLRENRPIAHLG